jgi:group I intron endonuclease
MKNWTIYKIVNPVGQVYIGKTSNYRKRMDRYRTMKKYERQRLIYDSIISYGFNNHSVEMLERFDSDDMGAQGKEMFWIRTYMSNYNRFPDQNGLNLTDGGAGAKGCKYGQERAIKLSKAHKGKTISAECREKMRIARINSPYQGLRLGKKHSEESRLKMKESQKGKRLGQEHPTAKMVVNSENGVFYDSIREAANSINKNTNYLHNRLCGKLQNRTSFKLI